MFVSTRRTGQDRGTSAVETALLAPFLLTLLFGIIDYGWTFGETLSLRSAVREAARQAVVNEVASGAAVAAAVRARADNLDGDRLSVAVRIIDGPDDGAIRGDVGDTLVVCAHYPQRPITGLGDVLYPFPDSFATKAVMRMEQVAAFDDYDSTNPAWSGTCDAA